ncbi:hypothetical protein [Rhodococcoides yunnanense]|uniref:Uncharacterized protein n=1 Tax=Rhodococcoides yunnanense TaxID=278209 RepID=A0ABU4BIG8_9NOCA|nr:hypothetical protein [Rhodococcus yunnanensis]MDV6263973.1 hypothetical protein [Rhodococcus yunnanensis]
MEYNLLRGGLSESDGGLFRDLLAQLAAFCDKLATEEGELQ